MISRQNHISKATQIARIAILLTGMTILVLGGGMGLTAYKQFQEQTVVDNHHRLKIQAQVFVDQFFHLVDSVKNSNDVQTVPAVTHRGMALVQDGMPIEIEALDMIRNIEQEPDFALEERVLDALKKQIKFGDLAISKVSVGTFAKTGVGAQEGIYIAQPVFAPESAGPENPTPQKNSFNKILKIKFTLVDPALAFGSLAKWGETIDQAGNAINSGAAYLVSRSGKVIAHSKSSFVGTQLSKIDSLKETLNSIFLGAQTGTVASYDSIDGNTKQVALVRAGIYPFAMVVETNEPAGVLSSRWFEEQWETGAARKALGIFLILIAIAIASTLAIQTWFVQAIEKMLKPRTHAHVAPFNREDLDPIGLQIQPGALAAQSSVVPPAFAHTESPHALRNELEQEESPSLNSPISAPPRVAAKVETFTESQSKIEQERTTAQDTILTVVTEKQDYEEFVRKIEAAYATDTIETELCDFASQLTESPVLFLRYYPRTQNLSLVAAAGDLKISNSAAMQVFVRKDIEQQITQFANQGKVASISNYAPLARMMISNLNIAHFEAWAVASDTSVDAYGSKMVGVLVILRAGFKSAQVRPLLAKAIRETGNNIHVQNNRIQISKEQSIVQRAPGISPTL